MNAALQQSGLLPRRQVANHAGTRAGKEITMTSILESGLPSGPIVYLDTEFTDLDKPQLLSLGMVNGGGDEFYVELDPDSAEGASALEKASAFARESGVLEQWGRVPGAQDCYGGMARRTEHWLRSQLADLTGANGPILNVAIDFPGDFELLERLLRPAGLWDVIGRRVRLVDVSELSNRFDGAMGAEAAYVQLRRRGIERHHALADAHALRAACIATLTGKRVCL